MSKMSAISTKSDLFIKDKVRSVAMMMAAAEEGLTGKVGQAKGAGRGAAKRGTPLRAESTELSRAMGTRWASVKAHRTM